MTGKTSHGFLPNGLWRPGAVSSEALDGQRDTTNPEATRLADRFDCAYGAMVVPHPTGRQYAPAQISGSKKWGGAARGGDSTAPGPETGGSGRLNSNVAKGPSLRSGLTRWARQSS